MNSFESEVRTYNDKLYKGLENDDLYQEIEAIRTELCYASDREILQVTNKTRSAVISCLFRVTFI